MTITFTPAPAHIKHDMVGLDHVEVAELASGAEAILGHHVDGEISSILLITEDGDQYDSRALSDWSAFADEMGENWFDFIEDHQQRVAAAEAA